MCACPKSGPELPTSYVMVFVNVQLVKVRDDCSFSCIFGMVDNHCLYVHFIFENDIIIHDLCWCIFVQIDKSFVKWDNLDIDTGNKPCLSCGIWLYHFDLDFVIDRNYAVIKRKSKGPNKVTKLGKGYLYLRVYTSHLSFNYTYKELYIALINISIKPCQWRNTYYCCYSSLYIIKLKLPQKRIINTSSWNIG